MVWIEGEGNSSSRGVSCISSLKIIELGYNNNYTYRLEYIDDLGDR